MLTLPSRQTTNKHHQRSGIIFGEFFSECWHFTFYPIQDGRFNSFVGLGYFMEVWPLVSSCINPVAVRAIKREQLGAGHGFRVLGPAALRSRAAGGQGDIGLNKARRSQESGHNRSGD